MTAKPYLFPVPLATDTHQLGINSALKKESPTVFNSWALQLFTSTLQKSVSYGLFLVLEQQHEYTRRSCS